ncbi:MAG: class III poly(R)-hydroxyalkanoic acid synthase subunit PhaE [Rhodanobacteraceae bacterium]
MAKTPDSADTLGDWQNMSRQYWDAWADATRKAFDAGSSQASMTEGPWHEGLEQWSRMFNARKAGDTQSEVVERLLGGARSYFSLLESLADKGAAGKTDPHAWTDMVRESFNFPGADAALFDNPMARAMRELAGHGAKGFEQMMQGFEPMMAEARALLEMPAFGYLREHQEYYQQMATACLDYQRETNRYNILIARASRRAFEVFEDKLTERSDAGPQIDTVRRLYDLWVEAAEDAYAEVALSDEFREVYGALVNAQMRVRKHAQQAVERVSSNLGIPTRSEIDSMGKYLHDVRREARNHAEQLPALAAEVAALRDEVARLKRAGAPGLAKKRTPTRNAPRKARKSTGKEKA